MKKVLTCLMISFNGLLLHAQPPAGDARPGEFYGEKVTADAAINISEIPGILAREKTLHTKITATVLDVCPKKGCWLKLAVNDTTNAFVKMKDYAFFLPAAIKGRTIVLDGQATMETTSVAELRHYAKDAKKSPEEIASITNPESEIRFVAEGILVVH